MKQGFILGCIIRPVKVDGRLREMLPENLLLHLEAVGTRQS
jgi:hypothetical protein